MLASGSSRNFAESTFDGRRSHNAGSFARRERSLTNEFPQARGGQVWKSLETDLLEKARILLDAEVSEFELTVAKARKKIAAGACCTFAGALRGSADTVPRRS
jgi:hypothetical protein